MRASNNPRRLPQLTSVTASVNQRTKLLGLEVVRFVSAISILVWHYQHFFSIEHTPSDLARDQQPLYSIFSIFYNYGTYGVNVFWCISGFIFFWKYRHAIAEQTIGPGQFFLFRFSRLYPLHFATLLLVALLQLVYFHKTNSSFVFQYNDSLHFFLQLFLASDWGFEKGYSFNGPIWSVSVEVVVYLVFYLCLRYISKSAVVNIGILSLCALAKLAKVSSPFIDCLSFFYIGGLSSIVCSYFDKRTYKHILFFFALSIVLTAPLAAVTTSISQHKHFTFLFLMIYVPALLYVCARNVAIHPRIGKIVEAAGNMTYSIYLIHFPIQIATALLFAYANQAIPYYNVSFFIGYMLVTLVASYYIYYLFELPAQTWIRNRYN